MSKVSERFLIDRMGKTFISNRKQKSSRMQNFMADKRYSHMLTPEGNLKILNTSLTPIPD